MNQQVCVNIVILCATETKVRSSNLEKSLSFCIFVYLYCVSNIDSVICNERCVHAPSFSPVKVIYCHSDPSVVTVAIYQTAASLPTSSFANINIVIFFFFFKCPNSLVYLYFTWILWKNSPLLTELCHHLFDFYSLITVERCEWWEYGNPWAVGCVFKPRKKPCKPAFKTDVNLEVYLRWRWWQLLLSLTTNLFVGVRYNVLHLSRLIAQS